jgi:hypothetical protein
MNPMIPVAVRQGNPTSKSADDLSWLHCPNYEELCAIYPSLQAVDVELSHRQSADTTGFVGDSRPVHEKDRADEPWRCLIDTALLQPRRDQLSSLLSRLNTVTTLPEFLNTAEYGYGLTRLYVRTGGEVDDNDDNYNLVARNLSPDEISGNMHNLTEWMGRIQTVEFCADGRNSGRNRTETKLLSNPVLFPQLQCVHLSSNPSDLARIDVFLKAFPQLSVTICAQTVGSLSRIAQALAHLIPGYTRHGCTECQRLEFDIASEVRSIARCVIKRKRNRNQMQDAAVTVSSPSLLVSAIHESGCSSSLPLSLYASAGLPSLNPSNPLSSANALSAQSIALLAPPFSADPNAAKTKAAATIPAPQLAAAVAGRPFDGMFGPGHSLTICHCSFGGQGSGVRELFLAVRHVRCPVRLRSDRELPNAAVANLASALSGDKVGATCPTLAGDQGRLCLSITYPFGRDKARALIGPLASTRFLRECNIEFDTGFFFERTNQATSLRTNQAASLSHTYDLFRALIGSPFLEVKSSARFANLRQPSPTDLWLRSTVVVCWVL